MPSALQAEGRQERGKARLSAVIDGLRTADGRQHDAHQTGKAPQSKEQ